MRLWPSRKRGLCLLLFLSSPPHVRPQSQGGRLQTGRRIPARTEPCLRPARTAGSGLREHPSPLTHHPARAGAPAPAASCLSTPTCGPRARRPAPAASCSPRTAVSTVEGLSQSVCGMLQPGRDGLLHDSPARGAPWGSHVGTGSQWGEFG